MMLQDDKMDPEQKLPDDTEENTEEIIDEDSDEIIEIDDILLEDDDDDDTIIEEEIEDSPIDSMLIGMDDIQLSKHTAEGKHSLKYDSIFKGKKEEADEGDDFERMMSNENFEVDKSSQFWVESIDNENYIKDKRVKEKVYEILSEHAIGMTPDMFKHIVALNTYSEPFLSMRANDQRNVIEQLLGITLLSEKADLIKEKIRLNKDNIQQEEFRNKAVEEANKRVQEQIDGLRRRQKLWQKQHEEALNKLVVDYDELSKIDIDLELQAHKDLAIYLELRKKQEAYEAILARQVAWKQKRDADIAKLQSQYDTLSHIDINVELQSHYDLKIYEANKIELDGIDKNITILEATLKKDKALVAKLEDEISKLEDNVCYACGQDFHDENHTSVINSKRDLLAKANDELAQTQNSLEKNKNSIFVLGEKPTTHYKTEAEAIKHSSELERIQQQIVSKQNEEDPYADQLIEHSVTIVGSRPVTHYDTEAEAIEHRTVVANLEKTIAS